MKDLLELVGEIFRIYGFEVRRDEVFDLIVRGEGEEFGVCIAENLSERDLRRLEKLDSRTLVITPSRVPEDLKDRLQKLSIELWDRERLEREIGRAILHELLGDEKLSIPIKRGESGSYIKLRISDEEAMRICRSYLGRCDVVILEYRPFWVYEYEVEGFRVHNGSEIKISGRGEGALNALTGENYWISIRGMERVKEPQGDVVSPEIEREEAVKEVKRNIKEKHVVRKSFTRIVRDSVISEARKFYPEDDEIDLKMELVYIPIWEGRYKSKKIEINGFNGEPLEDVPVRDVEFL